MTYKPRGVLLLLLAAVKAEPEREFTSEEAAAIMGCHRRAVGAFTEYAVRAGLLFKRSSRSPRVLLLRGTPFPGGQQPQPTRTVSQAPEPVSTDDVRIPRVVEGWKPPTMVAPRSRS